jgi:ribosome-binding factor A
MESIRQKKVAELIKTNLSEVLQKMGLFTIDGALVTITHSTVTPDLLEAKIYLSIFNAKDRNSILSVFDEKNKEIRHQLSHKIGKLVRRMPELQFYIDDTLDEVFRLEALFQKIKDEDAKGNS